MNERQSDKIVELNTEEAQQVTGGQTTAIEYGLIAAQIGTVIIAGATTLGQNLKNTFTSIQTRLK